VNHSPLVLFFLFFADAPGSSEAFQRCSTWQGRCVECLRKRKWTQGIFCANYFWAVGGFTPCKQMWCGACYISDPQVPFHVNKREDQEGGNKERNHKDQARIEKAWGKGRRSPTDYLRARDGDHLLVPFQCDLCLFRKLRKRSPDPSNSEDALLAATVRRMNLDAFWCTATATVYGNKDKLDLALSLSELVGLDGPCIHIGPLPSHDHCGYEVAAQMLLYSKRKGRNSKTHCQFDTIRKVRTCHANQVRASPQMN
jgi:hypothetical protein